VGRFTRSLCALLDRWRPDVVWALGPKGALLAAPACRLRGVPVVWHKVDLSWDRELAMPLAAAVHGVLPVSEGAAAALGPLRGRVLAIVPPPVTLPVEVAAPLDGPLCIGTLARAAPYKGHERILRAAALLSGEFPDLRVLASCGPVAEYPGYREQLLALAGELGLGERVELPEWVDDRIDLLRALTVFVTATYRDERGFGFEGLSTAMLEAAWAGVPVVASAGGGTAEGLIDGETGRLVSEADPELLAEAIRPYLRDPVLRARTGEAARAFARERFAPDVVAPKLFAALRSVADR
jgi:glycosyltransferase involved in cell wall biosynthesis